MIRRHLRTRSLQEEETETIDPDFWSFEDKNDVWILVCSIGVGLTTLFLLYRLCRDCFWVEGGSKIKKSLLSERLEQQEKEREEKVKRKKEKKASKEAKKRQVAAAEIESEKLKNSQKSEQNNHDPAHDGSRIRVPSKSSDPSGKNQHTRSKAARRPSNGSTASVGSRSKHEPRRQISASKSFDGGTKRQRSTSSMLSSSGSRNDGGPKTPRKAGVKGFLGPAGGNRKNNVVRSQSPPRRHLNSRTRP
eukprot:scaffold16771_cov99-Cylindrotheca_fusiformis.AAC.1